MMDFSVELAAELRDLATELRRELLATAASRTMGFDQLDRSNELGAEAGESAIPDDFRFRAERCRERSVVPEKVLFVTRAEPRPDRRAVLVQIEKDRPGVVKFVGARHAQHADIGRVLHVMDVSLLTRPPILYRTAFARRWFRKVLVVGAPNDYRENSRAVSELDVALEGRPTFAWLQEVIAFVILTLVLEGVVQQRRNPPPLHLRRFP